MNQVDIGLIHATMAVQPLTARQRSPSSIFLPRTQHDNLTKINLQRVITKALTY